MLSNNLLVLGSSSASPTKSRHQSAHLLQVSGRFFLLDCGEGAQNQLKKFGVKFQKIERIFITHLHGDHFFGLIGLLNTFNLMGRTEALIIYSPESLEELIYMQLKASDAYLKYPIHFVTFDSKTSSLLFEDDTLTVYTIPLRHRIACSGYSFVTKPAKLKINKEAVAFYQIPRIKLGEIQKGADYIQENGTIIFNAQLTQPQQAGKKMVYCTDTIFDPEILPFVADADLLLHEATFLKQHHKRAKETYHSTAEQAAKIAKMAQVKKLVITHFSARYSNLNLFLDEAMPIFKDTFLAIEGQTYTF